MSLVLIAAVYIGFAVADGRPIVIAVECSVAAAFVVLAAAGITGPAWLLVLGFAGHGLTDLWQHRTHCVASTRWWPPFRMTIDWVAAAVIAVAIVRGISIHQWGCHVHGDALGWSRSAVRRAVYPRSPSGSPRLLAECRPSSHRAHGSSEPTAR